MIVSEINIKLSILGYGGVGKTSIANAFLNKEIPRMYIPTIGSNIVRKEYKLKKSHIRVNIWDIGGQRSFNPLNSAFFSNIDAVFLVFDLSNPKESLLELKQTYIENLRENSPECTIFMIGNKSDLIKPEDVNIILKIIRQSDIKDFPLLFTSAKTKINLPEAFELIIFENLKKWEKEGYSNQFDGISTEFLNLINKKEENIEKLIINLEDIDSKSVEKKIFPKVVKKIVSPEKEEIKVEREIIDYPNYLNNIVDFEIIKNNIVGTFNNNLNIVEDLILNLKRTSIETLIDEIEKTSKELTLLKDDFKLKLDSILKITKNKKEK